MLTDRQKAFRDYVVEMAQRLAPEYDLDWRMMAAAAILESGWGESELAQRAHNLFGIRATAATAADDVYLIRSSKRSYRFRRYASDEMAFRAYGALIGHGRLYEEPRGRRREERGRLPRLALERFVRDVAVIYCPDDPDYATKIIQIIAILDPPRPGARISA